MEENINENVQPTPPPRRRRKRSKWQDFKEAYLPVVIGLVALILIITFIVSSVNRGKDPADSTADTGSAIDDSTRLQQEADGLLKEAAALASHYDYQAAIALLNTYSAGISANQDLMAKSQEYQDEFAKLVEYTDVEHIPNLSFNLLIADLPRALADETYGSAYNKNYVTTGEFQTILQELYDNGYILVSLYDIASVSADGTAMTENSLYLPEGRKPIVLTQTGVNYFTYMVDGDGDGKADKDGAGFASRLIVDANGKLTNEMVDASGNTVTGAFDLIPILDAFVEAHPDFSYKGAKATIAVTGYDGLFGYRTDPETAEKISQEYYNQQVAEVGAVVQAVRNSGYDIACYTYEMVNYSNISSADIQADLEKWTGEVAPYLGNVDILVYPWGGDVGNTSEYSGNKYAALKGFGFKYFIGQDTSIESWGQITTDYLRQTRRWVTGANMKDYPEYFADLFNAEKVLDSAGRYGS